MDLKKKIIVIAGASSGLGYSLAELMIKEGHIVVGISRTIESCDLVRKKSFIPIPANLTKMNEIIGCVEKINSNIGEIDCVINCVGEGLNKSFLDITNQDFINTMNTNLFATIFFTQQIYPLIRKPFGLICNISSIAGIKPFPFWSLYCAAKYGLEGFTSALREELRSDLIKVVSVRLGSVDTPSYKHLSSELKKDFMGQKSTAKLIHDCLFSEDNATVEEIFINNTVGDI